MEAKCREFLSRRGMNPEELDIKAVAAAFRADMEAGLAGGKSSLGLYPAYVDAHAEPKCGESVLVLDAGGTNLRAARMRREPDGRMVTEALRKSPMPGTRGEISAEEMFAAMAREAAAVGEGCEKACIGFSYPCEVLPDRDGIMKLLTKELKVTGLVGSRVCAPLEEALKEFIGGGRKWQLINDTVAALLCGAALGGEYRDTVGFILGTGTNCACSADTGKIKKVSLPADAGKDMAVNLESGGYAFFPRGDADELLDKATDDVGNQWEEKAVSGAYLPELVRLTAGLAVEDGLLPGVSPEEWAGTSLTMADVNELCLGRLPEALPGGSGVKGELLCDIARALCERAAKISAAVLGGAVNSRELAAGDKVCIFYDGTTFEKNPLLKPLTGRWLEKCVTEETGVVCEFRTAPDATLTGSAYAALLL